jgi:hypothetical protein
MVEKPQSPRYLRPAGENLLGIFAKEPVDGEVKTRLTPPLDAWQAAELYRASLEETVARLGTGPWRIVLFHAGRRAYFAHAFPGLLLQPQTGGDLGSRMAQALGFLLSLGQRAILVGSDSPDLPLAYVQQAFAELQSHEVVLAPAADGGYILIGERRHHPELFRDIPWSTAAVFSKTRSRAAELGIACAEVPPWEDIDDFPSLQRLLRRSPQSTTARRAALLFPFPPDRESNEGGESRRVAGEDKQKFSR